MARRVQMNYRNIEHVGQTENIGHTAHIAPRENLEHIGHMETP